MFDLNELDPFGQDVGFGYLDRTVRAPRRFHPKLVLNTANDSVLRTLRAELRGCSSFTFSVAFVSPRAIALLKQEFVEFQGVGTIITSDYLGFNSPQAFYELHNLKNFGIDVRLHSDPAFHPKGYVFERPEGLTAILGSSNLTESALARNHEWNLKVSADRDSDLATQFSNLLEMELAGSVPLTIDWIADYAKNFRPPSRVIRGPEIPGSITPGGVKTADVLVPNVMQVDALQRIEAIRSTGAQKSLVISATGTGKTILSALHVQQVNPKRMLFVAHREQILDRAMREFARVIGMEESELGKLAGHSRQIDRRYVFATVQTLSQDNVLAEFDPDHFDYILIDEVHRAAAASYLKIIDHFSPEFMLGMTATPERSDGLSIFELFDYNVPYEIRLTTALELGMLAPFHYYGVADFAFDDGLTTSDVTPLFRLIEPERVNHVLSAIVKYGQAGVAPRGLIFCSRNDEANYLSAALNQRTLRGKQLRTIALSGANSIAERELAVEKLEAGELDYLVTVDIFNEGVDIPTLNQVIMLRQTKSSIVFVQQLGRGLRKSPGKEYLVVIDFIGNYANNYMIPIALFGDDSLNRESLRKNLIGAEEIGVVAGLSSVRFDRIAQRRVLQSLATTKLDSFQNLTAAIEGIRNRLGRIPALMDFLRFESVDPVLLATKLGNYPSLLEKLLGISQGLTSEQLLTLTMLSQEVLSAKRPHELILLRLLLEGNEETYESIAEAFEAAGVRRDLRVVMSAVRTLTLEFSTKTEKLKYGSPPAEVVSDGLLRLAPSINHWRATTPAFGKHLEDLVETGLALVAERYVPQEPFTLSRQYSRKDASRLLCWSSNMYSTIYGYKVDTPTQTCPIFVTYHKSSETSASTAYADELLDPSTMLWYSKSKRSLQSDDVSAIVQNRVDLHVFAKKDDAEGAGFYYLGRARAENAEQTTMGGIGEISLSVVRMHLRFETPIDASIFDYFEPSLTID